MNEGCKSLYGLCVVLIGLGISGLAVGATGVGPYYATPSWDQKLDCTSTANCPRFLVLTKMSNEAVLDRETGLVWEQSPTTTASNWLVAVEYCVQLRKGGRQGWRLATIQELASLLDTTVAPPGPTLPVGHPFSNVSTSPGYWSATTYGFGPSPPANAWLVVFANNIVYTDDKSHDHPAWCVRGGSGLDIQ